MRRTVLLLLALVSVASCRMEVAENECAFPSDPVVVKEVEGGVLQFWDLDETEVWNLAQLPADSAYTRYRAQIIEAGADEMRPPLAVPESEKSSPGWQRELRNVELAYGGHGSIRPINCLEALLFAYRHAQYDQIENPSEFLVSILRKVTNGRALLRVYLGAGDSMFPPKEVYGLDEAGRDVAAGWHYVAMLHNHTIQREDGRIRLGVVAPSANDVQLLRSLVERHGLESARVTNGLYTVEIPASQLEHFHGPE